MQQALLQQAVTAVKANPYDGIHLIPLLLREYGQEVIPFLDEQLSLLSPETFVCKINVWMGPGAEEHYPHVARRSYPTFAFDFKHGVYVERWGHHLFKRIFYIYYTKEEFHHPNPNAHLYLLAPSTVYGDIKLPQLRDKMVLCKNYNKDMIVPDARVGGLLQQASAAGLRVTYRDYQTLGNSGEYPESTIHEDILYWQIEDRLLKLNDGCRVTKTASLNARAERAKYLSFPQGYRLPM